MSEENVEIMRAVMNAFAREDLPGFLPLMDPEIHFEPHLAGVEGSYAGHDGVRRFFGDAFEDMEILDAQYPDIRDLGDQVLVLGTLRLKGRESGVQVENPLAIVARVREGLITYLKDYADRDQALEAAGLSE
jgi:ketosteroid isomerase-like protein